MSTEVIELLRKARPFPDALTAAAEEAIVEFARGPTCDLKQLAGAATPMAWLIRL